MHAKLFLVAAVMAATGLALPTGITIDRILATLALTCMRGLRGRQSGLR
jgi:hypothetical protein